MKFNLKSQMKGKIKPVFLSVLKRIPLIGGLAYSTARVRREARVEFCFMWFASMAPIFGGVFVYLLTTKDCLHLDKFLSSIKGNFDAGEIFIFACASLAPAAFLMSKYNRDKNHFPNHVAFQVSLGIIFFSSALIFGLFKANAIVDEEFMQYSGLALYIYSLLVWYLSIVYNDAEFISFVQTMHDEEKKLTKSLENFTPPK